MNQRRICRHPFRSFSANFCPQHLQISVVCAFVDDTFPPPLFVLYPSLPLCHFFCSSVCGLSLEILVCPHVSLSDFSILLSSASLCSFSSPSHTHHPLHLPASLSSLSVLHFARYVRWFLRICCYVSV